MAAPAKYLDANGETEYRRYARSRPVKWWHTAIIDDMIIYPTATHQERATRLGYTKQAIMMLINSDMFKAAYAARRADFQSKLDDDIRGKMARNATLALDIMHEKLEKKRDTVGFKDLTEASNSLLDRLGYGVKAAPATAVQVNVNNATPVVTRDDLAEARARLREVESQRAAALPAPDAHLDAIDITPVQEAPPEQSAPVRSTPDIDQPSSEPMES